MQARSLPTKVLAVLAIDNACIKAILMTHLTKKLLCFALSNLVERVDRVYQLGLVSCC